MDNRTGCDARGECNAIYSFSLTLIKVLASSSGSCACACACVESRCFLELNIIDSHQSPTVYHLLGPVNWNFLMYFQAF